MSNQTVKRSLQTTRMVASFALLGAVVAGAAFGWLGLDTDLRPYGAFLGASAAMAAKYFHAL